MEVYLNRVSGIDDAIVSLFMSKRTWTRKLENEIRQMTRDLFTETGKWGEKSIGAFANHKFENWMDKLVRQGVEHITLLRFINFSITVEGLHRAGQDDWDSHAKRFGNCIVRTSTRLSKFDCEMSDYYKDKILPTDLALQKLNISIPEEFTAKGVTWVKTANGYVQEDYAEDKDVLRGLYMLSIPSNFIFKINLTEWAHVYKERNECSHANPEVKEMCERIATAIEEFVPWFNRELFLAIKN